jgi:type III secretory pathway component EscV
MANRVDFSTETVGKMLKAAAKAAHKNINAHTPMNRPKMVRSVWFNRGFAAGVAAATAEAEKKFRVGDKELIAPDGEPIVVQLTDSMESVERPNSIAENIAEARAAVQNTLGVSAPDVVDVVDTTADEGAIFDEQNQKQLLEILAAFGTANGLDPIKA